MLHRFYRPGGFNPGDLIDLEDEELHHAAHVVRLRIGEEIELFDGRGSTARATVRESSRQRVRVEIAALLSISRELPFRLDLAAALIQPDRFELVLQKATELGVSSIIPLISSRVETRIERVAGKRDRWQRIVLEASKQSGRAVVPLITEARSFETMLGEKGVRILFDADVLPDALPQESILEEGATLLIGPEGGWSEEELVQARAAGCAILRLGSRRLRAETASIAAIVSIVTRMNAL